MAISNPSMLEKQPTRKLDSPLTPVTARIALLLLISTSGEDIRCIIVHKPCHQKAPLKGCKIIFFKDFNMHGINS